MLAAACACAQTSNQWTKLSTDMSGARRGSAIRYASKTGAFFLWGFLNDDPDALQQNRLLKIPEYDMVFFDPSAGRWQNHLPLEKQAEWSKQLPMGYHPGIYMGITTGSRRTIMRGEAESAEGVPRPARTTTMHRDAAPARHNAMPKRDPNELSGSQPDRGRTTAQAGRLRDMPVNRWLSLADPGRVAPLRTWGTATFDSDRGSILYWGGEHCGYSGSDVDAYMVDAHTWRGELEPEHPGRGFDKGVSLAGVTFGGRPFTVHGRKIYAYDPVSKRMIMVRPLGLTDGYQPEWLKSESSACPQCVTWAYDPVGQNWERKASAPSGVTALVSTPLGVIGATVAWRSRLDRAGYLKTGEPPAEDNPLYLFESAKNQWTRLGPPQASPGNLYEMTSLAYDSRRGQVILHGGGRNRDELWIFNLKTNQWRNMQPKVVAPEGAPAPTCTRESVYIPSDDVVLIYGPARRDRTKPAMWEYSVAENVWRLVDIPPMTEVAPRQRGNQNRALVYDAKRDLLLLVLGSGGDAGLSAVFAMRYRRIEARSAREE